MTAVACWGAQWMFHRSRAICFSKHTAGQNPDHFDLLNPFATALYAQDTRQKSSRSTPRSRRVRRLIHRTGLGHLCETAHLCCRQGASGVSLSPARPEDPSSKSRLVCRFCVRANVSGRYLSGSDHGLVQPLRDHLEVFEKPLWALLPGGAGCGAKFSAQRCVGCQATADVQVSMDALGRIMHNIIVERLWRTGK